MIRHSGRIAAFAGLLLAFWLVWRDDPRTVLGLMRTAGAGLALAAAVHVLPMIASAFDWRSLMRGPSRPTVLAMLCVVWIRESVNGMLPVARVGGEVASFRLLQRWGVRPSIAAAGIVVDMQLNVIAQLLFTMAGIGFLSMTAQSDTLRLAGDLAWGVVVLAPLLLLFAFVQHASPFERITRILNRIAGGKLAALVGQSARIDQTIMSIWRRRAVVLRYLLFWQPVKHAATALELWVALYFLGAQASFLDAFVLEILIQAVSSAAFFVPAGLGVQEGGFVVIGGVLGLDPATCLALAGARRVRDLLVYVPGLFAWQIAGTSDRASRDRDSRDKMTLLAANRVTADE